MSAQGLKAIIFVGSAREGRLGTRVCKFIVNQMNDRGWHVDVFDPCEMKLPILEKAMHTYKNHDDIPPMLQDCKQKIVDADAFVLVTCEYNHCLPPGLTNLIDHFGPSNYRGRPSSIICYSPGMYGGMRAAMQARCLLGEINCPSIPNIFGMPRVHNSLDENGSPTDDHMKSGAETHFKELEWYSRALKSQRAAEPL